MRITLSDAATLFHADCRDAIRALPSDSVDSCVTDPPYAINFMGKKWDTGDVAFLVDFWADVYRVLKPGAFIAAFGATRQYHRQACVIEDAGFEIRDSLMWIYGTGFPKSQNVSAFIDKELGAEREKGIARAGIGINKSRVEMGYRDNEVAQGFEVGPAVTPQAQEFDGFGTALKPAFEPIVLARKPLSEGTIAANVLKWRTGALNIGQSRIAGADVAETRTRHGGGVKGADTSFEMPDSKGEIPPGRWPANVVTDGSDEVVGMFPSTQSSRGVKGGSSPNPMSWGDERTDANKVSGFADSGSAARFFYSAKASKADRAGSKHPTVKPISLMEWLATLITPPGGTILDPFAGSGTTGAAAVRKGFNVILCEREAEYVADIRRRFPIPLTERVRRELSIMTELAALRTRLAARA